ncbi:hypothetical protein [Brevibacillus laterosporus]|uniref:hypothetical protein n=1 Tax=Brevibacillus laterosporus TaxID=1465 RepID=UPI0003B1D724|nr:hypothetical protein [Brevibacillus laterosporus]ERM20343.1 hypothetical protein P615_00105 [Brevibacillus laterosporus PE36]
MKFELTCESCKETMSISFKNIKEREHLECFNCRNAIPEDLLSPLQKVAFFYIKALDASATTEDWGETKILWSFKVSE